MLTSRNSVTSGWVTPVPTRYGATASPARATPATAVVTVAARLHRLTATPAGAARGASTTLASGSLGLPAAIASARLRRAEQAGGPHRQHHQEEQLRGERRVGDADLRDDDLRDADQHPAEQRAPQRPEAADDHRLEREDQRQIGRASC